MPIYEYECERDGGFELERPMSQSSEPGACPTCGGAGRRILSLPRLAALPHAARVAHATNERARHEPRLARRAEAPEPAARSPGLLSGHGYPWALGH